MSLFAFVDANFNSLRSPTFFSFALVFGDRLGLVSVWLGPVFGIQPV